MSRIIGRPLNLTASVRRRLAPFSLFSGSSGSDDSVPTRCDELTRVPSLVEGCDYKHWLVVMEVPKGYPPRNDIVGGYVKTLAMALGSEEKAKKSIYSVSTKYYYAFGCRVTELMTYKIQSLPDVKWVLPDSFIDGKNGYGGPCKQGGYIFQHVCKWGLVGIHLSSFRTKVASFHIFVN
ncbi:PREDICTED: multiple organellar RNA editing factor 7, mitochondrial isoform X3 [Tarenaya hassleriana]|uniref:multiple organellar RNA editing factor 7, mitochondrial isoform X3 n=1 Tax=Tarenaya hassleriana TaxID=28532 RepID=UPI00053C102B|nr:PREDICTED: multiple organellar RNA editing factor 7, mitochondrial isoform X3 [Tarenaya hassleriana]